MISLVLAGVFGLSQVGQPIVLMRGSTTNGLAVWDVQDATIDGLAPNSNAGGDSVLVGGPRKKILIRFGDIDRVVGPDRQIRKARLVLNGTGADPVRLTSISSLLVPWGEGPYQTLSSALRVPPPVDPSLRESQAKLDTINVPARSATWRQRRAGPSGISWQQAGALGSSDAAPIDGAKLSSSGPEFRIDGLESAVQKMADRPLENFGFAISFETPVTVSSSKGDTARPRLEIETEPRLEKPGADLSVAWISKNGAEGKPLADGDMAIYTAQVKNIGTSVSSGFTSTWIIDERAGAPQENPTGLAPGEAIELLLKMPFHPDKSDHRVHTVTLKIEPKEAEVNSRNNELTVYPDGKFVHVVISQVAAHKLESVRGALGQSGSEDWVQAQVRAFNDVYLAQSRFSFAPEGCLERISVQRIEFDGSATVSSNREISVVAISDVPKPVEMIDVNFQKRLALACGLVDRSETNVSSDRNLLTGRGGTDRYPGLLGYGDTRYEGFTPGDIGLPYEPYSSPIFDLAPLESTSLLASTDVALLNDNLGGDPITMPGTIIIRAQNESNIPIPNLQLDFIPLKEGAIASGASVAFTLMTDAKGTALLPTQISALLGSIGTGAVLVRATANGNSDSTWLKGWQILDSSRRKSKATRAVAFVDLHFVLPETSLDLETNLVTDRIVTDSTGALPAKLGVLIDNDNATEATLGSKSGDWIEIDLGRDRSIGEVDIVSEPRVFWTKFDIVAYATGQKPEEAVPWAREIDNDWTTRNRGEVRSSNRVLVPYRGQTLRFRFLRIINRSDHEGRLAEIRVIPAKLGGS